jgi:hypothetical protein
VTDAPGAISLAATYDRAARHLVGRERELTLALAAVTAGRDLILEGPPPRNPQTHPRELPSALPYRPARSPRPAGPFHDR